MGFTDASEYRSQFPVTQNAIYLNHAAVAPLCRRASEAMIMQAGDVANYGALHYDAWAQCYSGLRKAAAGLIGATPEEIAIVKNTSEGIATVALGFDWQPGDRVIAFQEEFPANYFPWARLERRGVRVTWLSIHDPIDRIAGVIPGAKLLSISFVNYLSGYRVDLNALGALCRQFGCFFFVDAIQGLGAYPLNVEAFHIDGLAADGHKWLLGPEGNGILYVRRSWLDTIEPAEFGWTNPARYYDYASRDMTLRQDAGRYECGTLNTIGCFGLRGALEFLAEVGMEVITPAVDALAQQLYDGVRNKGYDVFELRTEKTGSGIVSFRHRSIDARTLVSDLKKQNILAASRQGWVRAAPHFYIQASEIDEVLAKLPSV